VPRHRPSRCREHVTGIDGHRYQWQRNGSSIATGQTFEPEVAGDYTCTVTATNQAGSTSQTSAVKKVKAK
jgi:hypothetical protein